MTTIRRAILHSITDMAVEAAAADVMDMDRAEWSTSRILAVRNRRCPGNNNYSFGSFSFVDRVVFRSKPRQPPALELQYR
jgi:hypothetical protein